MALPTALFALIAAFGLATAAILSSVDVQQGTRYDQGRKGAIAAADGGASVALWRLNRFQNKLTPTTPCVGPAGEAQAESSPGWCPSTSVESLDNGASSFTYQVSAFKPGGSLKVVSIGTAGSSSRRVEVGLFSTNWKDLLGEEKLIGKEKIELEGNADIRTDMGTNGDVTKKGNSATVCGNIRHGIGKTAPEPDCNGEILEGERALPPVNPPAEIETNNSNCRLVPNCEEGPEKGGIDPWTGTRTSSVPWDAGSRTINVQQSADLTMGGNDYFVCALKIVNGTLIMASKPEGGQIRIYVDTPEHCGLSAGAVQVEISGNGKIESTGFTGEGENASVPAIFVLGSPTIETTVKLNGTSQTINELMLYAPYSNVDLGGNATYIGIIAGKSLKIHGNPTFESRSGIKPPEDGIASLWERTRYVECTGPTGSPPDASC